MLEPEYHWITVPFGSKLPPCPAVYAVYSGDAPQYVGKAKSLHARWNNGHHRMMDLVKLPNLTLRYLQCSEYQLKWLEIDTIKSLRPALNTKIPTGKTKAKATSKRGGKRTFLAVNYCIVEAYDAEDALRILEQQPFTRMSDPPELEEVPVYGTAILHEKGRGRLELAVSSINAAQAAVDR